MNFTVTAFRHFPTDGLGSMEAAIKQAGGSYRYIDTCHDSLDGFDPLQSDLLVVMGGSPGVYQADDYPFLKDEMKAMEHG